MGKHTTMTIPETVFRNYTTTKRYISFKVPEILEKKQTCKYFPQVRVYYVILFEIILQNARMYFPNSTGCEADPVRKNAFPVGRNSWPETVEKFFL